MRTSVVLFLLSLVLGSASYSQTNFFLIARTTGEKIVDTGDTLRVFGYASSFSTQPPIPAPLLEIIEGDSVFIDFLNMSQGHGHTIHLHGLDVDQQNDGVPALSFEVGHMDQETYKFKAPHPGTYLYHCHVGSTIHLQAGMYGPIIVRPSSGPDYTWDGGYQFDQELLLFTSEIDPVWHEDSILDHMHSGNPMMDTLRVPKYVPQYFLVNGLSNQQLDDSLELKTSVGAKAYLRLVNIGYCANTFILPSGLNAQIVSSDGRPLPQVEFSDTIEVYPGERYGVLCEANTEFLDSIQVIYSDMNTGGVKNIQYVEVEVDGFNQVNEDSDIHFNIYPNPVSERLQIEISNVNEERQNVKIYDMNGKLVNHKKLSNKTGTVLYQIDVSEFATGEYTVVIDGNGGLVSKIFVKK